MTFWDYNTGTPFQNMEDIPQPGSLEAEAGVFCSTFDVTGTRLITGGADKTIKVRHSFLDEARPSRSSGCPRYTPNKRSRYADKTIDCVKLQFREW
jgi:WD40 repeat protein